MLLQATTGLKPFADFCTTSVWALVTQAVDDATAFHQIDLSLHQIDLSPVNKPQ